MYGHLIFLSPITWFICSTYVWGHLIVLSITHMWNTQSLGNLKPQPELSDYVPWHYQLKCHTYHGNAPTHSAHLPNDLPLSQRVVSSRSSYAGTILSAFVLADYRCLHHNHPPASACLHSKGLLTKILLTQTMHAPNDSLPYQ